jgi:aminoglycoside phosphotransferase (APT) family kinase protein
LAETTGATKRALVHGDVSPKNILVGPEGPVFLDAECAWYGDPAFDLAFCLNHLLLKCLWRPAHAARYLDCFAAMSASYLAARVDGKSPVEYITEEATKERLRQTVRPLILRPRQRLAEIAEVWAREHVI